METKVTLRIEKFAHETLLNGGSRPAAKIQISTAAVQLLGWNYFGLATYTADTPPFNKCILSYGKAEIEFHRIRTKSIKPTLLALPEFNGEPLCRAAQQVVERYGDTHYIVGIEYLRWLCRKPKESPEGLRNVSENLSLLLIGSVMRGAAGSGWVVPCTARTGGRFMHGAVPLSRVLGPDYRILLLEKLN
jgi:hypothetical protein